MSFTGAEIIVQTLEREGVRLIAGIPGGALLPLYEALGRSTLIRHVLARHEQAAGFIAQGIARITGKAAVCLATSGPGVTNVVTALADAKLDSIPIVCIAGQVPTHLIGTDAFQEVPTIEITRSITKASFFVRRVEELAPTIVAALRLAEEGRPGPVLIDVPKDVQMQTMARSQNGQYIEHECGESRAAHARAERREGNSLQDKRSYTEAAEMIQYAKRPVLYVGGGVTKARAHHLVEQLAERNSIPVTTTLMALGTLPTDHNLSLGMLGMHGARFTNLVLDECDLVIAIGARFDDRATGKPDRFVPRARIIHIDIDAREFGKIKQPTLSIQDDAGSALRELLARIPTSNRDNWLQRVRDLRDEHPLQTPLSDEICSPYGIVRATGELAPADAILTTDVGQHQMWVAQTYPFYRPDRWLTSGGLGTMGFGLPAAIGAALIEPHATTICFTGDGSLLMNIQELATLAELDLNVKIILFDNASLGLVRQQQELFYRKRFVASHFQQPTDFVALAKAFGIPAFDLQSAPAPYGALANALSRKGPTLIRVPIAAEHHVLPMVAPGAANTEALDHATSSVRAAHAQH
jgi:acetolactate synthase I/II/III large subunit